MKMQVLPARAGWEWVKLGIQAFFKQPVALGGLFCMFMAVVSLLSVIPLLGTALALALIPATTLGLMVATLEVLRGKFPMPSVLAAGLRAGRERLRAMWLLGIAYAGSLAVLFLIAGWLIQAPPLDPSIKDPALRSAAQNMAMFEQAWPLVILYLPISMAFWHAPALVHWYAVSPAKSLFFSLIACLRNWKAYTVFSMAWMGLVLAAGMLSTLVFTLFGLVRLGIVIQLPLVLIISAMFYCSLYFSFRDSFVHEASESRQEP